MKILQHECGGSLSLTSFTYPMVFRCFRFKFIPEIYTGLFFAFLILLVIFPAVAHAGLNGSNAIILVNENSPTSRYIADMYRQYHPDLPESNVVYLSGLVDCSGPDSTSADEILTRQDYEELVAAPVRDFLLDPSYHERIYRIRLIITTAGIPYRIASTNSAFAKAIYPAGSNPWIVSNNTQQIDAASVESELTCLWHSDFGDNPFGTANRMVNPYQGYRCTSVTEFDRSYPGQKEFHWDYAISFLGASPLIEGYLLFTYPYFYGTKDRHFNAGDIYLTCRLDGPKQQGESAVFAVRAMLERAKLASSPEFGVDRTRAVALLDDVPGSGLDQNRVYNLDSSDDYLVLCEGDQCPPDAATPKTKDDYVSLFEQMTGGLAVNNVMNLGPMPQAGNICMILDRRHGKSTSQINVDCLYWLLAGYDKLPEVIFYCCFGTNGDEALSPDYLTACMQSGQPHIEFSNGSVFTSIESFNGCTMFSDVATSPVAQGKIIDFIAMGGTAALGHSFEPISDAIVDNEYLLPNLLEDTDGDDRADLTFVEAAFSAIPFLSWSEVVIGDPLMRIAYGPGCNLWWHLDGDADNNGEVNTWDIRRMRDTKGGNLSYYGQENHVIYDDLSDFDHNGIVNIDDIKIMQTMILDKNGLDRD